MKKNYSRQPAQIGIAAVLLTTILLAIGVSVSSRVAQQVSQENARNESSQSLNAAESGASNASGGSISNDTLGNQVAVKNNPDVASIYLNAGETVEIKIDGTNLSAVSSYVYWELDSKPCDPSSSPALLISHYRGNIVNYYPINTNGCSASGNRTGYTSSDSSSNSYTFNGVSYHNRFLVSSISPLAVGDTIRIKVLYGPTYISMNGLVTTTRAAASNEGGNQVRVVEERRTTAGAPSIMDYALFAGGGSITK